MFFLPFKFDMELYRLPFVTILVCLLCLGVYWGQYANEREYVTKTESFCETPRSTIERMMLEKVTGGIGSEACLEIVSTLSLAEDRDAAIDEFVAQSEPFVGYSEKESQEYTEILITRIYDSYRRSVPRLETKELWYHPHSWDPWSMITASFAHGSWGHVIGNLFFFFAFAAAVEVLVGPLIFIGTIVTMAFGTGVSYSIAMANVAEALPTVGLSGIVMGMMALFTFFLPTGRIKCFYWILIKIGTVSIPAWLLTLWFVGFDTYTLITQEEQSGVNLVYHVSGAVIGFMIGIIFLRRRRGQIPELVGD